MNILKKLILFCLFLSTGTAFAQPAGKVIEEQNIKSDILKQNIKFAIYLPADYETSNRNYPVVYLLHGYGDDHTG